MQNPPLSLSNSDPKIKYDGNPRNSLERIFSHYLNSSENQILSNEKNCFENIRKEKNKLIFTKHDALRAMELLVVAPSSKEVLELYSIIKEHYSESEVDIKFLEKQRFKELISMHNPPLNLSMMLLDNIENFNFEEDFEIVRKLNANKSKSPNAHQIFEKTLEKFQSFRTDYEKNLITNRLKYDEILNEYYLNYNPEKINKFFKSIKIFDDFIFDDLKNQPNIFLKELAEKYESKFSSTRRLSFSSHSPSPSPSAPSTPSLGFRSIGSDWQRNPPENLASSRQNPKKIGCDIS